MTPAQSITVEPTSGQKVNSETQMVKDKKKPWAFWSCRKNTTWIQVTCIQVLALSLNLPCDPGQVTLISLGLSFPSCKISGINGLIIKALQAPYLYLVRCKRNGSITLIKAL